MDTRRRCACDLVKGMAKQFEAETTQLCGAQITALLAAYDASPGTEWRKKDAAVQVLHLFLPPLSLVCMASSFVVSCSELLVLAFGTFLPSHSQPRLLSSRPSPSNSRVHFSTVVGRSLRARLYGSQWREPAERSDSPARHGR